MSAAAKKPRLSRRAMIIDVLACLGVSGLFCLGMYWIAPNADAIVFLVTAIVGLLAGAVAAPQVRATHRQAYEERD